MSKNPLVSVIMGVFNGEKHLREAIKSILNQTFKDFEFVIINDCSKDKTSEILRKYNQEDERIKIVNNHKNIGLTKSLNKALKITRGKYIARMDADDISYPERLEKQIDFLSNNLLYGLIGTWGHKIDKGGNVIGELKFLTKNENIRKALIKYNPFIHSSIMLRSEVFKKVGPYNKEWRFAQDYELFFRIIKYYKVANIPEILMAHRWGKSVVSYQKNKEQTLLAIRARKKVIKEGLYKKTAYIYLIRPYLAYILPKFVKYPLLRKK